MWFTAGLHEFPKTWVPLYMEIHGPREHNISLFFFYHVSYLMVVSENLSLDKLRDEKLLCIQLDKILGLNEERWQSSSVARRCMACTSYIIIPHRSVEQEAELNYRDRLVFFSFIFHLVQGFCLRDSIAHILSGSFPLS